ncbi:MAG: SufD family Fe-S cluster assembly protein [Spirochaetes bacterium]|uniref:SufD family Fe-S cluster assembly protein n=1 Tax=Candidatus Ornithospirochaeta stercoravium TaxID=2840897 RepID=A0A9D9IC71_9SPIO|nr:SufD family Fe-S cluster assembly protein [Candidatus Ornithospirochaeta stercoravium]
MNSTTEEILKIVSDWKGSFCGAYSIREDGKSVARMSTEHVHINPKEDKPGLDIIIDEGAKDETISIPACVTHGDVDDLVYNDFYIGKDADVTIIAGCGVHTDNGEPARHNGIHRFFLGENAKVRYLEKHVGLGNGDGRKSIDPVTEIFLDKNASMEMETSQIGGVTDSKRVTNGVVKEGGRLVIHERLLTEKKQKAYSEFSVDMIGDDSSVDLVSRSVAKDESHQDFKAVIYGNAKCSGHSECDAIITGHGTVSATPQLDANNLDASLIHEAAIGKIAGEELLKLRTFGLTEEEAEERIIKGFLR